MEKSKSNLLSKIIEIENEGIRYIWIIQIIDEILNIIYDCL